jgi:predicted metal-dependent enzyme (double-stranded beta helix superfamily)
MLEAALAPSRALAAPSLVHAAPAAGLGQLAAEITGACDGAPDRMVQRMIAALRAAAADPILLTAEQCLTRPDGYARHVLYADPHGRFTILALVWAGGQFSPVHAHDTWCAYAVHRGALAETLFRFDAATTQALPLRTETRRAGYGCFARSGLEQVHRLGNAGLEPAISIHVYGVDAAQVCSHVNRVLDARSWGDNGDGKDDEGPDLAGAWRARRAQACRQLSGPAGRARSRRHPGAGVLLQLS